MLAFGDSLTEGMVHTSVFNDKTTFHPYSKVLQKYLPKSNVIESGISGEEVAHMRRRLRREIANIKIENFSAIVILGGTNDIGKFHSVNQTAKEILGMHDDIRGLSQHKPIAHSVAVTLPPYPRDIFRAQRIALNAMIREYAAQSGGFTKLLDIEDIFMTGACRHYADPKLNDYKCLHRLVPYEKANARYWDYLGSLHFSKEGYEALGLAVYNCLCDNECYFASY